MRERGQSLVETALIMGSFMALLLAIVHVGVLLVERQALMERVKQAARWGATQPFEETQIRNLVLFGTTTPTPGVSPFSTIEVRVRQADCPGPACRVLVAAPAQGIEIGELVER
jgi:TadE-like protein